MLKRISLRKLSISLLTVSVLLLMYFIPGNTNDLDVDKTIEYDSINDSNLSQIFLMDNNEYIALTTVLINEDDDICKKARELVEALIIDGKKQDIIPNGFKPIIPSGTTINDVNYDNGVLKIDFSSEILDIKEEYEEKMIESICYTLTGIEGVDNVLIYIDGKLMTNLPNSNKYLPTLLSRDYGINKEVDITDYKDVLAFNVYYVKVYNDNHYYVPVTKYVNSQEDKIKVIIEELASAPTYEVNLMSLLNSNTKLVNYNFDNKVLSLEFNEFLVDDVSNMNLNNEVANSIIYSLRDNYDLDEVVFMVNNQEILKSVFKTVE